MNSPQNTPLPAEVLQQLKDIHSAPAPGWWPPAPGWWLLAALVLLASWWGWRRWQHWRRQRAPWQMAEQELAGIRARWQAGADPRWVLQQISELLRRVARHCYGTHTASLTGEAWLQWLDEILPEAQRGFVSGPGQVLAQGLYRPDVELDPDALLQLANHWLKAARKQAQKGAGEGTC